MKKIALLSAIALSSLFSAQMVQAYKDRADIVSQTNLQTYNADLAATGVRYLGNSINSTYLANNNNALTYINQKLLNFGYTSSQIQLHNAGSTSTPYYNLIVTKTGTVYPDTYVIIGAHFDSVAAGVGANEIKTKIRLILPKSAMVFII
ncbi:hypothetical protein [uncultured Chryseobacterium sp.]|uniref:hypothetical protein n=1 Tax=uncultured Chryseobacterium sp. TaxID=259322 RepID=UPI00263138CD|nr:hypothetical protein [uncultured Chryseobacterium sp.]